MANTQKVMTLADTALLEGLADIFPKKKSSNFGDQHAARLL